MAIKVNGTTVINDSRALSNIASVDATTVAAMSAAGVGATAEPVSGGWAGWTTQTQLASYSNTTFTYTIPSNGWYRLNNTYGGNGAQQGYLTFNTSTNVSWFRAGSQHDRSYELMGVGNSFSGEWYYNTGNKYWFVLYMESGETISHTYTVNNTTTIFSLT